MSDTRETGYRTPASETRTKYSFYKMAANFYTPYSFTSPRSSLSSSSSSSFSASSSPRISSSNNCDSSLKRRKSTTCIGSSPTGNLTPPQRHAVKRRYYLKRTSLLQHHSSSRTCPCGRGQWHSAASAAAKAAWVVVLLLAVTCVSAADGARHVVRETLYGRVKGEVITVAGDRRVENYFGVPYAKPPIGRLRFEAPQPPEPWDGVLRTTELPPACPQPKMGMTYIDVHKPGFSRTSEDCLYLNIHSPEQQERAREVRPQLPVVVFVHGGSYHNGMGAMMDGDLLATYDVIVVTFNYRLGALGFLSAPDSPLTGNYGMLDQVQALRWVKDNIHFFGGDADRITIDGHSSGGCSVGLLMLSPLSAGLFTGVIAQSGSPFAHWAVDRHPTRPSLHFKHFVSAAGCGHVNHTDPQLKHCLQALPSDALAQRIMADEEVSISLVPPFQPVVDGYFLPDLPEVLVMQGKVAGRYFMTGATLDEGLMAAFQMLEKFKLDKLKGTQKMLALMNCFRGDLPQVHGIVESILDEYSRWPYDLNEEEIERHISEMVGDYFIVAPTYKSASLMAALNLTVFVYNYEYRSLHEHWDKGVMHGADMYYISGFPLKGHKNQRYDESDKRMSQLMMQMWANFARNGLPSLVPLEDYHMPRFTLSHHEYTKIAYHRLSPTRRAPWVTLDTDLRPDKMAFWNSQVPQMFQMQLEELLRYPPAGTVISRDTEYTDHRHLQRGRIVVARAGDSDRTELNTKFASGSDVMDKAGGSEMEAGSGYLLAPGSNSWILIAACIGLSALTVLLSACYCRVRRQVNSLLRQSSMSSGQTIL